jgi:two-component system OmpR family sensor kinase
VTPRNASLTHLLTRRLAWLAVAVVFVNAIAVVAYYGSDRQALEVEVIERQMDRLEAALYGAPPRIDHLARALFEEHPASYGFAVLDQDGRILDAENPHLIPSPATETGVFAQDWVTRQTTAEGQVLIAAHKIDERPDQLRLVFVMADDPAGLMLRALAAEFGEHIWLPILPVALILIGANAFMIRRGLAPVGSAAQWARSIRPGRPTPPLPNSPFPAEIMDLVEATQRSLERVHTALAAEKRHVAEAAHALRTPVAVLVARLDALPPGETTDRLRADLTALSRTVRQVLASARADVLDVADGVRTDLVPIADNVTAALAPLAYQANMELSLNSAAESIVVIADPEGVEVALFNLVENAIVHGRAGLIEISVGPGPQIRVRDHGPGLPSEGECRLFEPFWRAEGAPPGGSGLGLAIVERLQQAQGGAVSAVSPPGGGAEFILSFRPVDL